jgi:hypothetical protein
MAAMASEVNPPQRPPALHSVIAETAQTDIAAYIADLLGELRDMAQANGQVPLSHLLDVARREAITSAPHPRRAEAG